MTTTYFKTLRRAFNKFINALFGGRPNEPISTRWGRALRKDRCVICKFFCYLLHLYDPNHCENSVKRRDGP
jgi:hypothetical protein